MDNSGTTVIHGPGDLRPGQQVAKRGTMSGPNFNYLYAPVPLTVSDRFLSNFQDVLSSPSCTTYRSVFLYVADLRSSEGYDFVMLSLRENIRITMIAKILEIYASFNHLCASIPQYVTIRD